jgi:hypothetical protein
MGRECVQTVWCPGAELNHRHLHFQCSALPTELPGRRGRGGVPRGGGAVIRAGAGAVQNRGAERISGCWGGSDRRGLSLGLILGLRGGRLVLGFLGLAGDRVDAGEPAVEVDIGTAAAAEGAVLRGGRLAADRAARGAGGGGVLGHGVDMGKRAGALKGGSGESSIREEPVVWPSFETRGA